MGRIRKKPAGHRVGEVRDRHAVRGSNNREWERENPEDDPFRDLRPEEDEMRNPANDEYVWPDLHDEDEDDD